MIIGKTLNNLGTCTNAVFMLFIFAGTQYCLLSWCTGTKPLTYAGTLLLLGSSKGAISRQECIAKIADSINYVHSQTANVITGMICTISYN